MMEDRHGPYLAAASLAVVLAVSAWRLAPRCESARFPRQESDFLSAAELDRRLDAAARRLKADPEDIRTLVESGILHFQKGSGHYPDAINELEEARRLGALDVGIFYYLGVLYQSEGLYQFAVAQYQKYLRNRPDDVPARMLLAKLQFQDGQHEAAAAHYERLHKDRPQDLVALENLAQCLLELKRGAEAAVLLDRLAAHGGAPGRRARFFLGRLAFQAQDYKLALRHYIAVLPVGPDDDLGLPPERVEAAVAADYEKLRLPKEAKEHWDQVLRYDPQNAQAKAALKALAPALKKLNKPAKRRK